VVAGADRGTISSSLISIGSKIVFDHIRGDPRGREYDRYRWPDEGMPRAAERNGRTEDATR
jgi:hypothetical protein